ncbi:MAG: HPr family phosphocarrier protein [Parachlamydiaceae bacterium]|nr:HPr family phosphocarrier protein [Parachlamydiaceae bacterium]
MTKQRTARGTLTINNDRGLHTRPSTEIVKCAVKFKSSIMLHHQESEVSAKSLLGILMLAAPKGARITVKADGEDASEAVEALQDLANLNFNIHY